MRRARLALTVLELLLMDEVPGLKLELGSQVRQRGINRLDGARTRVQS